MRGLAFEVDCFRCGSPVQPLAHGRCGRMRQTMVVKCERGHEWQVLVELLPVETDSAAKKRAYRERVTA